MKKIISLILATVLVIGCGAAFAQDSFDPSAHTLVFATILVNHPVLRCVELGFIEACEELGYQYQVVGPEGLDYNEMNAAAEAAAVYADGVLLWAQDAACLTTIDILKNDYECLVGVPHVYWPEGSAEGLDFCMACIPETYAIAVADYYSEHLDGKTGSIAVTQASYNENEDAAAAAFIKRIGEHQANGKLQGVKVLDPAIEGASDITESTNVNASIIQANPDLIAAFSLTGNGPVTWSNAARKCGLAPGDISIIAMDYTADNLAEIEAGYCTAIVAQPLYAEAYESVYYFSIPHPYVADRYLVNDVSFNVHAGEVVGLAGLVGAGRSETAMALYGEMDKSSGEIYIKGKNARINSSKSAIAHGVGLVTEDRKKYGLHFSWSIKKNISLSNMRSITRMGIISPSRERKSAVEYYKTLRVKAGSLNALVDSLSGGNQQKVVIARSLNANPSIIILDEPTKGIDVGAKVEIYQLINDLAEKGVGILLISSELPELMAMSDRFVVMAEGRVVGELSKEEATDTRIMNMAVATFKEF